MSDKFKAFTSLLLLLLSTTLAGILLQSVTNKIILSLTEAIHLNTSRQSVHSKSSLSTFHLHLKVLPFLMINTVINIDFGTQSNRVDLL